MRSIGRRLTAAAIVVALALSAGGAATAWPAVSHEADAAVVGAFDPSVVHQFSFTMLPADWERVRRDRSFELELPATLTIDGTPLASQVLVRRKSGVGLPSARDPQKVALKISINGIDSNQKWNKLNKLSLEASANSPISEGLAWLLQEAASVAAGYGEGYDAALASWVNVSMNGSNLGIYLSVEQRNKTFVKNRKALGSPSSLWVDGSTWLYKQTSANTTEQSDGPASPSPQVAQLCFSLFMGGPGCAAPASDAELEALLTSLVDMRSLLTMSAVNHFLVNFDEILGARNNFYWVDWTGAGAPLRRYYPWDMDLALDRSKSPVGASIFAVRSVPKRNGTVRQSSYEALILNHPTFRAQYRDIAYALTADGQPLSQASLLALLDQVQTLLTPYLLADPYFRAEAGRDVAAHFQWLRTWLSQRTAIVRAQLDANLPAPRA